MKANIHPKYYEEAAVTCSCGNSFKTGSVKERITVEVCFHCHPFYTGEQRFLDTKGRVEKFQKKQQTAQQYKTVAQTKKRKEEDKGEKKVKSLKELLNEI